MRIDESDFISVYDDELLINDKNVTDDLNEINKLYNNLYESEDFYNLNNLDESNNLYKSEDLYKSLSTKKINVYFDYFLNNERQIIKYEDPLLLWKLVAAICNTIVGYFRIIHISSENSNLLRRVS